jgi:Fe-S cluster assembly scaffold protein SufB
MAPIYELIGPLRRAFQANTHEDMRVREEAWGVLASLHEPASVVLKALCHSGFLDAVQKMKCDASFVKSWPKKMLERDFETLVHERDPIALLAHATCRERVYITIPDSVEVSLELISGSSFRCHVNVGDNAIVHLKIVNNRVCPSNGLYSFDIGCGGFINVTKVFDTGLIDCLAGRIWMNEGATYQETCIASTNLVRNSTKTIMHGERSTVQFKNLSIVPSSAHVEGSFEIDHKARESHSFVLHKAVVADGASSSFHALCRLQGQRSVSHSYVHHLTLGKNAHICAQPMFEIFHDDVEAFHGCTSQDIDEELMLYAASRGIDSQVATKLFVEGFCNEILRGQSFSDRYVSTVIAGLF